jgi:putative lipoprotein
MRAVVFAVFAGALFAMSAQAAEVTGTATYLARIAPPPGAVFEATLEDVSRADAPARPLGAVRIEDAGAPPYRFAIPYDPAGIDERMTYAVRATLRRPDGRLMFTTDTRAPALTQGGGETVEIIMRMVSSEPLPLVGPLWRLVAMGEAPVVVEGQTAPPHLVFDAEGAVFGSGGCNRLRGGYQTGAEGALSFAPMASTMMACPEAAMRLEDGFTAMLGRIDAMAIDGDRLILSAQGAPLATFEAE